MLPMALLALASVARAEEPVDFRGYVDQARFFLKREWYADAADQLELAVGTPDGRLDPEAWFLLAKVRYELADLAGARHAADRALVNARTPEQTAQAAELLRWLTEQFGYVELVPPRPGVATRLDIALQSVIFDPDLKLWFNDLIARLDGRVALPITLGLPAGRYLINGEPVEVVNGEDHVLRPRIRGGSVGLQTLEVTLGAGVSAWFGPDAGGLLPAPTVGLAVSAPVGPIVVGVLGDYAPQPFQTTSGAIHVAPRSWSVGARLGLELPDTAPLVVRPSLGWRYARVGGLQLACHPADDGITCGPPSGSAPLRVHATGHAQVPFAELALLYLDRERSRGLGGGLAASAEYALGALPRSGVAAPPDDGTFDWTGAGRWQAFGLRVTADLTYAF